MGSENRAGSRSEPNVAFETKFTRAARHFFRGYRNGPFRLGHPLLRRLLRLLLRRHQRVILRNGLKMQLDLDLVVQHTIFWLDGDMEPQLTWAVREFLPCGGAFIDCGANCGCIGLEARLYKQARVLFVEPHPELAAAIRQNIALNGWEKDCKLFEAAASNAPGTAPLFICKAYDGSHSLLADWWAQPGEKVRVDVPLITVRQLMETEPGFAQVDFLKIDTEGHDLQVLHGLGDRLRPETISMLYTELGRDRDAACRLLMERGYTGFEYQRLDGVPLRRAVSRAADGQPVALYLPWDQCGKQGGETLWCAEQSPAAAHLRELARRSAA